MNKILKVIMKQILMIILIGLLQINPIKSQERVNKELPKINLTTKGYLNSSTGWLLNPEGQWISRNGKIPFFIENKYELLIDYEEKGLGLDNFFSYEIRDIVIKDSLYSILIKKYINGFYRYNAIKEGWYYCNSISFYVFEKPEINKLNNIKSDSTYLIKLKTNLYGNLDMVGDFNNNDYLKEIEKEIKGHPYSGGDMQVTFQLRSFKSKDIVQFVIFKGNFSIYPLMGVPSNEQFNYCYYETTFNNFNEFIKIK